MIKELMKKIVDANLEGIDGILVARKDGVEIISTFDDIKKEHLAPITAAVIGSAEIFLQSSGVEPRHVLVLIESETLNVLMVGGNHDVVIAILAKPTIDLYHYVPKVKALSQEITELIGRSSHSSCR